MSDITKLPKWAQEKIRTLERERDTAIEALNKWTDNQTPSAVKILEALSTGETQGPTFKTRYVQTQKLDIGWAGVWLSIHLPSKNDPQRDQGICLSWGTGDELHGSGHAAFIPTGFQGASIVAPENMRK